MTNANEMAQKGFDTGFTDANDNELHVGDYVRICGHIGKIVFSCGAFGIFIADEVPWDALEELVRKDSGNRPSFLYNDTFISFWEIVWNLSEDTDEPCLPYVESITATGGIFTNENGNKDVFMGCINGCFATLTQCECHRSEGWRYRGALWAERNRHLRRYRFPERCALGSHQGQGMAAL